MKYVARYNGAVVGKRTSDRTYTHAIVTQASEAEARAFAYDYRPTTTDRKNFDFRAEIADQGIAHWAALRGGSDRSSIESIMDALECIEGGFDGFIARERARHIENFERWKANGGYEPKVIAWAGRLDLAQKRARECGSTLLAIVEAEVVS